MLIIYVGVCVFVPMCGLCMFANMFVSLLMTVAMLVCVLVCVLTPCVVLCARSPVILSVGARARLLLACVLVHVFMN